MTNKNVKSWDWRKGSVYYSCRGSKFSFSTISNIYNYQEERTLVLAENPGSVARLTTP